MKKNIKIQCAGYLDPIEQAHPDKKGYRIVDKNKKIIGWEKILKMKPYMLCLPEVEGEIPECELIYLTDDDFEKNYSIKDEGPYMKDGYMSFVGIVKRIIKK